MLYRGVNKITDQKNDDHLLPMGNIVEVIPLADGKWKFDGTFKHGPCESNTARAHQIDSGLYGGSGISTSRSEQIAIRFATSDYMEEGYVYVIDETLLAIIANVICYEFDDPVNPHEKEVTLLERSGGALPEHIIIEKYAVNCDGKRI
ncbi:MAG: hypothetical protein M0R47_06415 [Methylobacter sp.]|jgi:hypothetical protein|uniref:hypothetical protein n=1 Tax=Methylobacter sp. TaxID=2051955 RepID=UPI0025E86AF4|nr:hypothetical protein [Methylobacter sp.]MCK9620155.1 hypothetical protein [Methylobacter sp.]